MLNSDWLAEVLLHLWTVQGILYLGRLLSGNATTLVVTLTVLAYLLSLLIFSGYLFGLIGKMRGTVLSQIGFTPLDIVVLIPTLLLTLYRVGETTLFLVLRWLLVTAAFVVIPPVIIALLVGTLGYVPLPSIFSTIGLLLYAVVLMGGSSVIFNETPMRKKLRTLGILGILQVVAFWLIVGATTPGVPATSQGTLTSFLQFLATAILELNVLMILIATFTVAPIALGKEMAEQAKTEHLFHLISAMVLDRPLATLHSYRTTLDIGVDTEPKSYVYSSTTTHLLFLIAAFPSVLVISQSETGDARAMTKLTFIKRDIVLSHDITPAPAMNRTQPATLRQRVRTLVLSGLGRLRRPQGKLVNTRP